MYGILKEDICEATEPILINHGSWFTKKYVNSLFKVIYKKGTRFYEKNGFWSTKNNNGQINQSRPLKDFLSGKVFHPIFSNLEIKNIKPQKKFSKK